MVKPDGLTIKNLNGWFDSQRAILHGYLSVWVRQPEGEMDYAKFHSSTTQLSPPTDD